MSTAENALMERNAFFHVREKSDRIMSIVLVAYFIFGLFLATFYDTWIIAIGVGTLSLAAYFLSKSLLPGKTLYQYVLSAILAIFSALFIYQMHGLFEMHFFFFVGSALLITYRNWTLILPLLILTVIHHATFAWLQYSGMREIYFTQLEYMELQAFLFHAALAAVIMGICGFWSYDLGRTTKSDFLKNAELQKQLKSMTRNIAFADAITNGDLTTTYETDNDDALGRSLLKMRTSLVQSSQREEKEKFITVGITKIGDIIRHHANDPVLLADNFINVLVKYTKLNQGALFIHEHEGNHDFLSLAACYAYERKKYLEKKVNIGEGLVGQCFLEREPIYMTSVPEDYVKITSGLGEANAQCIFIVPVKTEDEVVGVIELASFKPLMEFEKQFIIRAAENIASTIVSSRATQKIRLLLTDAEQRTEEMRSQEEEMRQNMEELHATQEEMARKQVENENRIKSINESGVASIEFNTHGIIQYANESFLKLMGYSLSEIQNKHHRIFVDAAYSESAEYTKFWEDLRNGIPRPGFYERVTKNGNRIHIKGGYSIINDQQGKPVKIIKLAVDVTSMMTQMAKVKDHVS
jgi:methyl-accepting chemotaxis protein